jgi:hypothetical protein
VREAALLAALGVAARDQAADALDGQARRLGDVERLVEPGPHRDDLRHLLGAAGRERLGEVAAAAVTDDRDLAPGRQVHVVQDPLEPVDGGVGALDVEGDAGPPRGVAEPAQPGGHHGQRLVAGQETGDEQDG